MATSFPSVWLTIHLNANCSLLVTILFFAFSSTTSNDRRSSNTKCCFTGQFFGMGDICEFGFFAWRSNLKGLCVNFFVSKETQAAFDKALKKRQTHEVLFAAIGGPKLKELWHRRCLWQLWTKSLLASEISEELLDMVAQKGHLDGWGSKLLGLLGFGLAFCLSFALALPWLASAITTTAEDSISLLVRWW